MQNSYGRTVESLSGPVRREFEKLQRNLQESAERHLHEQEFLMVGFLEDMLRLETRFARDTPLAQATRPTGATESTQTRAYARSIALSRHARPVIADDKATPASGGDGMPPHNSCFGLPQNLDKTEKEWLAKLGNRDLSFVRATRTTPDKRAEMKMRAMTDVQLLLLPVVNCLQWISNLKEPKRVGWLAQLVTSAWFHLLTLAVIIANCVLIWIESDLNWAGKGNTEVENVVFIACMSYYCIELVLNLYVHRLYFFVGGNAMWNILDFFLIVLTLFEAVDKYALQDGTRNLSLGFARVMRLLRVGRLLTLLKALSFFTVVRVMMDCLVASLNSLFWASFILGFIVFIFAMFFSQAVWSSLSNPAHEATEFDEQLVAYYGSNWKSALALFKACSSGEPWAVQYDMLVTTGWANGAIYIVFLLFFQVCVWNVFTSIVIHKAAQLSSSDRDEQLAKEQKMQLEQTLALLEVCRQADVDKSGKISLTEFLDCMQNNKCKQAFAQFGFELSDAELLFDMLGNDNEEVAFTEFIECCLRMKGLASSLDLHVLLHRVKLMEDDQHQFMHFCLRRLSGITERLQVAEELTERSPGAVQAVQQDIAALARQSQLDSE